MTFDYYDIKWQSSPYGFDLGIFKSKVSILKI